MQAGHLFRLASRLQAAALRTSLRGIDAPASPGELAVGADVALNPGSTISDIVGRTGLSQGAVSKVVARIREEGYFVVDKDPDDGRKVRISVAPDARQDTFVELGRRRPTEALAAEFGLDEASAARLEALLDEVQAIVSAQGGR